MSYLSGQSRAERRQTARGMGLPFFRVVRYNGKPRGGAIVADVQQIIDKIMSDPKVATSRNFSDRVYHDEPILFAAPRMERYTPREIRQMRLLARSGGADARIFYEQARLMESFEDDFEYRGEFSQYFPTYQTMTDAQLRGYFSWRARVRRGDVERTSLSFAFVHIYELLNQIGVPSPEEGFHALKNFWLAYREHDPRINNYVTLWLKDYAVYHDLDKSLLQGLPDDAIDGAVGVLLDHASHGAEAVFAALNSLSSYDMEESRFFKQYPDEVKSVVHRVFQAVSAYYNRNPEKGVREKLFGQVCTADYTMFRSAVFHHRGGRQDRVYDMGNGHRYLCRGGRWYCERFVWYGNKNRRIGDLLKTVDYLMRRNRGFKSALQPGKTNKILTGKIEREIAAWEKARLENIPREIDIDVSKLHGIRTAALATRNRLLVDEPVADEPPAPVAPIALVTPSATAAAPASGPGLSDIEFRFMCRLVHGKGYSDLLRSKGVILSVLIDGVNEKLFDMFGDTVIAMEDDAPAVIDDYRDQLKGLFPQ